MPYGRELRRLGRAEDLTLFQDLDIGCMVKDKQSFGEILARYRARLGEICEVVEVADEVSLQRVADGRWAGGSFPVCNAKRSTLEYDKTGEWRLGLKSDDVETFDWCLGSSTNGRAFYRGGMPNAVLGVPRKCDVVLFPRG